MDAHALALDFLSLGFRECLTEVSRYLNAVERLDSAHPLRSRLLSHLTSCASQRDAASLAMTSHLSLPHHHQQPHPLPHPFHSHQWAAAAAVATAAFRPPTYGLNGLPASADGGCGAPQRPGELSQRGTADSTSSSSSSSSHSSSSSSVTLPYGPAPLSASLVSLSASVQSFPISLQGTFPVFPHSSFTSSSPPVSSSSSQNPKPYRPWGTEVGVF